MPVFDDFGTGTSEKLGQRAVFFDLRGEPCEIVVGRWTIDLDIEIDPLKRHRDLLAQGDAAPVEVTTCRDAHPADLDAELGRAFVADHIGAADQGSERSLGR